MTIAVSAIWRHAENFLYRCTSTFSPLTHCSGILLKYFYYLHEVHGAHNLFRRFFDFSQFLIAIFAKIVAPASNKNENYLANPKGQSLLKKTLKRHQNRPNSDTKPAQSIPLERTARRPRSMTKNQTYKHHIFTPTAGARCSISPKLCMAVELVVPILRVENHFSIQFIVFPPVAKC